MTQEVIEKHLLKVGSSRYQDQQFREKHPKFSPISRFGSIAPARAALRGAMEGEDIGV